MKFEANLKETVVLDPKDRTRRSIPSEIRKDPLTGRTARICHFMKLKWEKPDFENMTAGNEKTCPFCPDKVLNITPLFAEDL
ncbi:MAG: UDPglucose--hexose-phosphate uridylyltransferase, partial [Thermodesulfobacteriota bacterium]|nr:UDPglucose--hexose-phosphate uridylyltransferase [Thermodesulfobacteriota bacterium]